MESKKSYNSTYNFQLSDLLVHQAEQFQYLHTPHAGDIHNEEDPAPQFLKMMIFLLANTINSKETPFIHSNGAWVFD